jgi:hypothetical protein
LWKQTYPNSTTPGATYIEGLGYVWVITLDSGEVHANNNFGNVYFHDETAWAYGGEGIAEAFNKIKNAQNWGWTNHIGAGDFTNSGASWIMYAGAGRNIYTNGEEVGYLNVVRIGDTLTITFQTTGANALLDTHLWVGTDKLPKLKNKFVSTPGQLEKSITYTIDSVVRSPATVTYVLTVPNGDDLWIAAHADVRMYVHAD